MNEFKKMRESKSQRHSPVKSDPFGYPSATTDYRYESNVGDSVVIKGSQEEIKTITDFAKSSA